MADYYTPGTPATPNTLARAENIAAELVTIAAAFNKIPEQLELEQDRAAYALDTGVADAYVVALPHPWAAYTTGAALRVKIVNVNTGSCTIDVDGLGVKAIKRHDGTDPEAGDLPAGSIKELFYTGSVMQVSTGTVTALSIIAIAGGGTGATTAAAARTNLGSGTVGDAIFRDTTAAAVRTEIGSTTVGDAIFIAASEAAARSAISLGTAALVDTGVADGNAIVADATGLPVIDGSQVTDVVAASVAYADVTGAPAVGARVWLFTKTISSGVATVDIEEGDLDWTAYDLYEIEIIGLTVVTDDVDLYLQVYDTTLAAWQSDAADYVWRADIGGSTNNSNNADSSIRLTSEGATNAIGNASFESASGKFTIYDPSNATLLKQINYDVGWMSANSDIRRAVGSGTYKGATNAISGVRLLAETGNIDGGKIVVYGVKTS